MHLQLAQHRHLARDLPTGARIAWEMRFVPTMPAAFLGAVLGNAWSAALIIGMLTLLFLATETLRRKGFLGHSMAAGGSQVGDTAASDQRLLCFGLPQELEVLQKIENEFFEPLIFPFDGTRHGLVQWLSLVGGLLVLMLSTTYLGLGHVMTVITVITAVCLVSASARLFPAYYRLTPGCVEVLRYKILGTGIKYHISCRLEDARVVCRYDTQEMRIDPIDKSGGSRLGDNTGHESTTAALTIDLRAVHQRHAFVKGVFQAALCARSAPSLPDDCLLG